MLLTMVQSEGLLILEGGQLLGHQNTANAWGRLLSLEEMLHGGGNKKGGERFKRKKK